MASDEKISVVRWQHKIKILNRTLVHNGFKYKEGLNIDTRPFNPKGQCSAGGLYFTTVRYLPKYIALGTLVADVDVDSCNARVYYEPYKAKADRMVLTNIRPISSIPEWQNKSYCEYAYRINVYSAHYIPDDFQHFLIGYYGDVETMRLCQRATNTHHYYDIIDRAWSFIKLNRFKYPPAWLKSQIG